MQPQHQNLSSYDSRHGLEDISLPDSIQIGQIHAPDGSNSSKPLRKDLVIVAGGKPMMNPGSQSQSLRNSSYLRLQ